MNTLQTIMTRQSAVKLTDPEPPAEVMESCFRAAMRAPDHGKLRPWQFILIRGEARRRFGEVLAGALASRDPAAPEPALEKERQRPFLAPLVVVVAAKIQPKHPKIPAIEQALSAAAAAQNFMLALHAEGYGSMWKTGASAYDDAVKSALGLAPDDQIIAFLYVGRTVLAPPSPRLQEPAAFIRVWE